MVPLVVPESRALSAVMVPSTRLDSPCTSEVQAMSPSTTPSTCKSAEASTLPLMATSAPSTEKVEPPLATGRGAGRGAALGKLGSGFFENMGSGLQEGARIDRTTMDVNLEMEVRTGRAAGVADQADDVAGIDGVADFRFPGRHVSVAGHHAVTVADFDDFSVTLLGSHESNPALRRGVDRRTDRS